MTLLDVAKASGVSKPTVSHVLSGKRWVALETKERLLRGVEELGFQANPAACQLAGGWVSKTVAFCPVDIRLSCRTPQIQMTQAQLHDLGYNAPLYSYGYGAAGILTISCRSCAFFLLRVLVL